GPAGEIYVSDHARRILRADTHDGESTEGLTNKHDLVDPRPPLGAEPSQIVTHRGAGGCCCVRKVRIAETCAAAPRVPRIFAINSTSFTVAGTNGRDHGEALAQPKIRVADEDRRFERLALCKVSATVGKYHDRERAITRRPIHMGDHADLAATEQSRTFDGDLYDVRLN